MTACDVLIVGQGLAGTTLAWQLHHRGISFRIVDRDEPVTSSRIAAGLLTPITGKRLAPSWRYDEFLAVAEAFYRRVERETGTSLFSRQPIVRVFQTDEERERYAKRRAEYGPHVREPSPPLTDAISPSCGSFEMTAAARLRVAVYLQVSRTAFGDRFQVASLSPSDLHVRDDGVIVPPLQLTAGRVVFCQGFWLAENPLFGFVNFTPAKGEILTLRIPGLAETRTVNRGVWLLPLGNGLFQSGSTYDRDNLDHTPTPAGRDEILGRLREFLRLPVDVVDHCAAVRPIVDERKPLLGFLPQAPRVGLFNGLNSKGALLAPHFAAQLADAIRGTGPIEAAVDVRNHRGR